MADSRLNTIYKNEIISKLTEEFQYTNIMAVPKLEKIVLNVGVGELSKIKKSWIPSFQTWR